ncbi:MAG: hypothetical protein K2O73_02930, partial [Lachnospiraceae bacterium]|nr:hypothetical protein [Lachnospiraceae bacterium]
MKMKKRLAAVIMTLAVTFGMRIPAFAYCSMTYPVSASDLSGSVATPGFDFEASLDFDMLNKFWDVSTDQQQELKAYYGYDDLASSPYANGTLHLSGTSASESNPVTVTFSLSATEEWNLPMAEERIYVMQQFSDGSCKLSPAEFISRTAVSASFTDAVDSKILIISLDLGREGLIYDYVEDAKDISGVQSAVDKDNNPVTVTVSPLDWDRKAIAGEKAGFPYGEDVLTFADVNLEGATASEANPITVTFLVEGVKAGHDIS